MHQEIIKTLLYFDIFQYPLTKAEIGKYISYKSSESELENAQDSDLDYFVITEKNRLWLAKLFLVLFKRLFLLNSKKEFCINYFISESNLKIQEKNIFTSIELVSMIPVNDNYWHGRLLSENTWINEYCKNFINKNASSPTPKSKPAWSKFVYSMLNGAIGDKLEKRVMMFVYNKNKKKYAKELSIEDFELMFRTNEVQAKVHNSNHQGRILDLYAEKVKEFESRYNVPLETEIKQ